MDVHVCRHIHYIFFVYLKREINTFRSNLQKMHEDIDELERLRDEYMQKNKEQVLFSLI